MRGGQGVRKPSKWGWDKCIYAYRVKMFSSLIALCVSGLIISTRPFVGDTGRRRWWFSYLKSVCPISFFIFSLNVK